MFSSGVNLGGGGKNGGTGWQITGTTTVTNPVIQGNVFFTNPTPAILGGQQNSFDFVQTGQGFATTPANSQAVAFRTRVEPVQGALNPSGRWVLSASINGAAFTDLMSVSPTQVVFPQTGSYIDIVNGLFYPQGLSSGFVAQNIAPQVNFGGSFAGHGMRRSQDDYGMHHAFGSSLIAGEPGFDIFPISGTINSARNLFVAWRDSAKTLTGFIVDGSARAEIGGNRVMYGTQRVIDVHTQTDTGPWGGAWNSDFTLTPSVPGGDIANGTSMAVEAFVKCHDQTTNLTATIKLVATFKRVAGVYTQEGATVILVPKYGGSAILLALTYDLLITAGNPTFRISSGVAYANIIRISYCIKLLINS